MDTTSKEDEDRDILLFVGGVPTHITVDDLLKILEGFGEVKQLRLVASTRCNRSRGFGFFRTSPIDAQLMCSASIPVEDRILDIRPSNDESKTKESNVLVKKLYFGIENFDQLNLEDAQSVFSKFGHFSNLELLTFEQSNMSSLAYGWVEFNNVESYTTLCSKKVLRGFSLLEQIYYCFSNKKKLLNAIRSYRFKNNLIQKREKTDKSADIRKLYSKNTLTEHVNEQSHSSDENLSEKALLDQLITGSEVPEIAREDSKIDRVHLEKKSTIANILYFTQRNISHEANNFSRVALRYEAQYMQLAFYWV